MNLLGSDDSTGPADIGGVAVILLGNIMSICWTGEIGLADSGVSGNAVVNGVSTLDWRALRESGSV